MILKHSNISSIWKFMPHHQLLNKLLFCNKYFHLSDFSKSPKKQHFNTVWTSSSYFLEITVTGNFFQGHYLQTTLHKCIQNLPFRNFALTFETQVLKIQPWIYHLQVLLYVLLYTDCPRGLLHCSPDIEEPRLASVIDLGGWDCLNVDPYGTGPAGADAVLLVGERKDKDDWLILQPWLFGGDSYATLAFHSAGGSGSILRWAAERRLEAIECWMSWWAKASSTRPSGWRAAASQGVGGLRPFSSQNTCLSFGWEA